MPGLRILLLTHYFPPEVNAPANRAYEMGRHWVAAGHQVTVVTCAANHPSGFLYPGYRNRPWQREAVAGIDVIRIWTMLAANRRVVRRTMNYLSYLFAVTLAAPFLPRADIVVSTSPQFFCGLAGYPVSRLKRIPWVLEIRDLWPESIVAVGAMRPGLVTRALIAVERFAYRRAAHVVAVSDAFVPHIERSGIGREKISEVSGGVDMVAFGQSNEAAAASVRARSGLNGKFVVAYVGTHGMAHGLETVLRAADRLRDRNDISFLMVGDGAERASLMAQCEAMALPNVLMLPQMARDDIPAIWAAADAAVVLLRDRPVFEQVIPTKMLEAFAAGKPVLLGVRGKARRIVETGECGVAFAPEDAADLARTVTLLKGDPALARRMGENGRRLASSRYDVQVLARRYLQLLEAVVGRARESRN